MHQTLTSSLRIIIEDKWQEKKYHRPQEWFLSQASENRKKISDLGQKVKMTGALSRLEQQRCDTWIGRTLAS